MPRVQIKLCGLSTEETVAHAIDLEIDFIGFNFFEQSPRFVPPSDTARLTDLANGKVKRVGVFVDPTDDELEARVSHLDFVQLHGEETPERALAIGEKFGLPLIKALPVQGATDLEAAQHFQRMCDYIMFDAKSDGGFGGQGEAFDWSLLKEYHGHRPYLLAGGLAPENVAEAIRQTGTTIVDVSSGIETRRGVKDKDLMSQFVGAVQSAET